MCRWREISNFQRTLGRASRYMDLRRERLCEKTEEGEMTYRQLQLKFKYLFGLFFNDTQSNFSKL